MREIFSFSQSFRTDSLKAPGEIVPWYQGLESKYHWRDLSLKRLCSPCDIYCGSRSRVCRTGADHHGCEKRSCKDHPFMPPDHLDSHSSLPFCRFFSAGSESALQAVMPYRFHAENKTCYYYSKARGERARAENDEHTGSKMYGSFVVLLLLCSVLEYMCY